MSGFRIYQAVKTSVSIVRGAEAFFRMIFLKIAKPSI
jgi:hypothetical protein